MSRIYPVAKRFTDSPLFSRSVVWSVAGTGVCRPSGSSFCLTTHFRFTPHICVCMSRHEISASVMSTVFGPFDCVWLRSQRILRTLYLCFYWVKKNWKHWNKIGVWRITNLTRGLLVSHITASNTLNTNYILKLKDYNCIVLIRFDIQCSTIM